MIAHDKSVCIFEIVCYNEYCVSGRGSVWLERTAGGREAAGSNPVAPTKRDCKAWNDSIQGFTVPFVVYIKIRA